MPCGRLVALAALSEVSKLILKQVLGDEVERNVLSRGVDLCDVGHEAIEILAPQLLRTGSALRPVTRQVAGVQLVEERRRIAADEEPEETKRGHNP